MSYALAVWVGEMSSSNEAAAEQLWALQARSEEREAQPPTEPIRRYVEALLRRWPDLADLSDDEIDDSPWAVSPLIADADGDFFYFPMVFSRCEEASAFAAETAAAMGLVCFDPQMDRLRPGVEQVATTPDRWWKQLPWFRGA